MYAVFVGDFLHCCQRFVVNGHMHSGLLSSKGQGRSDPIVVLVCSMQVQQQWLKLTCMQSCWSQPAASAKACKGVAVSAGGMAEMHSTNHVLSGCQASVPALEWFPLPGPACASRYTLMLLSAAKSEPHLGRCTHASSPMLYRYGGCVIQCKA